jgi:hypothetical protein
VDDGTLSMKLGKVTVVPGEEGEETEATPSYHPEGESADEDELAEELRSRRRVTNVLPEYEGSAGPLESLDPETLRMLVQMAGALPDKEGGLRVSKPRAMAEELSLEEHLGGEHGMSLEPREEGKPPPFYKHDPASADPEKDEAKDLTSRIVEAASGMGRNTDPRVLAEQRQLAKSNLLKNPKKLVESITGGTEEKKEEKVYGDERDSPIFKKFSKLWRYQ